MVRATTSDEIQQIVLGALAGLNMARDSTQQLEVSPVAPIFGPGSKLDSLGLVGLVIDIEDGLRDLGIAVTLSDERAMSQTQSPFRDVPSLVAYISTIVAEMK
jgi:hypothetical protein